MVIERAEEEEEEEEEEEGREEGREGQLVSPYRLEGRGEGTDVTAKALSGSVSWVKPLTPARWSATAPAPPTARPAKPPFAPPATVAR